MKFLVGFVLGAVATFFVLPLLSSKEAIAVEDSGLNIFAEKGECITKQDLEIFQTIQPNTALAHFGEFPDRTLVLLINNENKSYYDNQKIKIPSKMCARQVGTYQYDTKMGIQKTVPIVVIDSAK